MAHDPRDEENAPTGDEQGGLVRWVTCPHCWHRFRPQQILWVAQHEDLVGDPVLKDEPLRFLPTRFTLEGQAIDARDLVCTIMACPRCHVVIPRVLLENETTFLSLIGSVGSGKSNLLATMTWQLRQQLARQFALVFSDGDKEANYVLNRNEESLFLPDDPERPIALEKTSTGGDLYRSARINGQETQLPKPFLFSLHPTGQHPRAGSPRGVGTILCLYDNAGEHYGVGQDTALTPVTRHLARSRVLLFLYDPTQDTRFRQRCRAFSNDPQITEPVTTTRQETILTEAALRIRRHAGLSAYQKYDRPLIILVGKSDIWAPLLKDDVETEPIWIDPTGKRMLAAVDVARIEKVSQRLRALLLDIAPELVTVAEDFCTEVLYVPVSALGHAPQKNDGTAGLAIKPKDVAPRWVTAPLLYSFAKYFTGLVGQTRRAASQPVGGRQ